MYAYTFLLPSGESPNTSDISLPDDGITDADTAVPNSEPLMLNVEEDNWQLIELVADGNPVDSVPFSVANNAPTSCLPPALPDALPDYEPDTTTPIGSTWVYPPTCPTLTIVTVPASLK